jgi:hypothetical protein
MFILFLLFLSYSTRPRTPSVRIYNSIKNGTSITLPGFYEAFPELKPTWPKWLKDKRGKRKPCKRDNDCPFPTTCCIHPILFMEDQFCCSGWGARALVPSYVKNYIRN